MRNIILLITVCLVIGCQSNPQLQTGQWTGSLSPMNHPEMQNPITYDVSYQGEMLNISIVGADDSLIPVRSIRLESDTLFFVFNEPEEQVALNCALGKNETGEFAGKCIDPAGKWAQFTMVPPSS